MLKQLWPWFAIAALAAAIHLAEPAFFPQVWQLIIAGDIRETSVYLRSFGAWTVAASILINIVINLSGILPTVLISGANAVVFGLGGGIVVSWIGECLGTVIAFVLWRSLLQQAARRVISRSQHLSIADEFSGKNGFKAMLVARLIPLAPSGLITLLGAISSVSFADMLWATLIGKLPSIVLEVLLGHELAFAQNNAFRLLLLLLVAVSGYGYFWWQKRRRQPKSD